MRRIFLLGCLVGCFLFAVGVRSQGREKCTWIRFQATQDTLYTHVYCPDGVDYLQPSIEGRMYTQIFTKGQDSPDVSWSIDAKVGQEVCVTVKSWTYNGDSNCTTVDAGDPAIKGSLEANVWQCDTRPPVEMKIGVTVHAPYAESNPPLWESPSTSSQLLHTVPLGTKLKILEGPVCAENLIWYKFTYKGKTGWIPIERKGLIFLKLS